MLLLYPVWTIAASLSLFVFLFVCLFVCVAHSAGVTCDLLKGKSAGTTRVPK